MINHISVLDFRILSVTLMMNIEFFSLLIKIKFIKRNRYILQNNLFVVLPKHKRWPLNFLFLGLENGLQSNYEVMKYFSHNFRKETAKILKLLKQKVVSTDLSTMVNFIYLHHQNYGFLQFVLHLF